MKKPNPVTYVSKDIAKFDTRYPIVEEILKQTQKIDLDNLSSIKHIEIRERFDKLRNDRYKNDNRPPPPGIPTPTPGPKLPRTHSDDDDFFNLPSPSLLSYNFDSPYISPAPDPPPLPYYWNSSIKDEDDDMMMMISILTSLKKFGTNSKIFIKKRKHKRRRNKCIK